MNKYLITFIVPCIEMEFDAYIPINKQIGTIKKTVLSSLVQLSKGVYDQKGQVTFIDKETGIIFDDSIMVKDSSIQNGTKIVII